MFCFAIGLQKKLKRGRVQTIANKELLVNEQIVAEEVRLLGEAGEPLGVTKRVKAQEIADSKNLDLVLIAPQGNPPVCRIMDYGKYRFEQSKRDKELRKNQKHVELKEVRMSLNIDTNDFNTKVGSAVKFLKNGDKVKVTIRFKGREMTHPKLGEKLMARFVEVCAEFGAAEKPSKFEGRNLHVILAPKKTAVPVSGANPQTVSQDNANKEIKEVKEAKEIKEIKETKKTKEVTEDVKGS